ncbi:ABC transporter ATP-binding protein, partial [Synechocystis salina LEGE 06155]|nr:ABC transporter ATP-binding protein [Synechocystis salina LEGE 06155]
IAYCLQSLPGVEEVEIKTHPQQQERQQILVRSNQPEELGQQLAQAIVTQGWNLYEMQRLRPTLEDVFLNLITSEVVDEETVMASPQETLEDQVVDEENPENVQ